MSRLDTIDVHRMCSVTDVHLRYSEVAETRLCTLVVITDADSAFARDTVSPEAAELDVSLGHVHVCEKKPEAKDGLSEDIQDSVGDDFTIDVNVARPIRDTPNTSKYALVSNDKEVQERPVNSHWVGSPENKGEAGNGSKEATDLATLGSGHGATVDSQVPDNDEIGNTGDGIPAPLLRRILVTKGSKETSEDHDKIGNNSHGDIGTIEACNQRQVE